MFWLGMILGGIIGGVIGMSMMAFLMQLTIKELRIDD